MQIMICVQKQLYIEPKPATIQSQANNISFKFSIDRENTLELLQSQVGNIPNMIGWYDANNYDITKKIWNDKSGMNNNSYYTSGVPLLYNELIDPSLNNYPILSGNTSASIRLPLGNYHYGGTGYQDFTFFFVLYFL